MLALTGHKNSLIIFFIFVLVLCANLLGFATSQKRERDTQRILDFGNLEKGLEEYKEEFGSYPLSSEAGRIIACKGPDTKRITDANGNPVSSMYKKPKYLNLVECVWGKDSLGDALDLSYPNYLNPIPKDPLQDKGLASYIYISDGNKYSILGTLELKDEKDLSKKILAKKIKCGKTYCNFGRGNIVE